MELDFRVTLSVQLIGWFVTLKFSEVRLAHFTTYSSTEVPVALPDKVVVGEPVTASGAAGLGEILARGRNMALTMGLLFCAEAGVAMQTFVTNLYRLALDEEWVQP